MYAALAKVAAEGLAVQALAEDLGWHLGIRVHTASASAKSTSSRSGIERVRHLATKRRRLQEAVKAGRFELAKVRGDQKPQRLADLATRRPGREYGPGDFQGGSVLSIGVTR